MCVALYLGRLDAKMFSCHLGMTAGRVGYDTIVPAPILVFEKNTCTRLHTCVGSAEIKGHN